MKKHPYPLEIDWDNWDKSPKPLQRKAFHAPDMTNELGQHWDRLGHFFAGRVTASHFSTQMAECRSEFRPPTSDRAPEKPTLPDLIASLLDGAQQGGVLLTAAHSADVRISDARATGACECGIRIRRNSTSLPYDASQARSALLHALRRSRATARTAALQAT